MKDAERLELLKEIAGTRTYDERRKESMKIMTDTDNRRAGIQEVITYIEQRLQELSDEKEELTQFQQLDSERRGLEYTIYDKELKSASNRLEELEGSRLESTEKNSQVSILRCVGHSTSDSLSIYLSVPFVSFLSSAACKLTGRP